MGKQSSPPLPQHDAASNADAPLLDNRILLVEDAPDIVELFNANLHAAGAIVDTATNGKCAIEYARNQPPHHLALIDIRLPTIDGFQTLAQLRDAGFNAPALAITALATTDYRDRAIDAGFDGFLPKPIFGRHLINACAHAIAQQPPATSKHTS